MFGFAGTAWGITRTTFRTEEGATVGPNVVVNGSFDADSDWIKPAGGTISDGKANWTGNGLFRQNTALDADSYYEFIYTVSDYTSGAIRVQGWTDYSAHRYGPGTFREIIYFSGGSSAIFISGSDTFIGSVSNITVRKITAATVNWNPRSVAVTGDSIAQHQAIYFPDTYPGDTPSGHSLASSGIIPVDCALGDTTFAWALSTGVPCAIASGARTIIIHAGVNDINTGRTWADVLADLNSIKALLTNQDLFIDEILPWTNGSDAQADTVRTWNANLATWCAENNAHLISSHDSMGQIRVSTGELDDLLPIYTFDGVHPTTGGVYVLWSLWLNALESFYGIPIKPNWTITASAGAGGAIDPTGATDVDEGSSQTFTIMPAANRTIVDILVDGVSVVVSDSYTFSDVTADHTITVTFSSNGAAAARQSFDAWWQEYEQELEQQAAAVGGSGTLGSSSSSDPYRLLNTSQASSPSFTAAEGASSSSAVSAESPSRTERICARVDRWIPVDSPRRVSVLRRLAKWLGITCGS
ncbi:MAG: SGNH/GDSL hydrolase family protein [Candidatus Peribacteraceae bacterium]|jgi:hypothetical protein|nr:SGNH/GDSL hydrolase family protein [Candidatus Peribacteraceae bacterium]